MNLVGKKVIHKVFGDGKVVSQDDSYVKVEFDSGIKKFVFPDVFDKFIEIVDEEIGKIIDEKIEEKEIELREERIRLEEERLLERERQQILREEKQMLGRKIHPELQSVFWSNKEEEDEIFSEWRVFAGRIKSGKKKGEPRKFPRMNERSACLITRRDDDEEEEDRRITGMFLSEKGFNGKLFDDGYIPAHPEFRLKLTEEESEKMYFWNYYFNEKSPDKIIWNSGRQRYFANIWMAQILRDIIDLKEDPEEKKAAEEFFNHFCSTNRLNREEIPPANGALIQIKEAETETEKE